MLIMWRWLNEGVTEQQCHSLGLAMQNCEKLSIFVKFALHRNLNSGCAPPGLASLNFYYSAERGPVLPALDWKVSAS